MWCRAIVNLPDWVAGTLKEVDENSERYQGYLIAQYVVPVIVRQTPAGDVVPADDGSSTSDAGASEETTSAPPRARKAATS